MIDRSQFNQQYNVYIVAVADDHRRLLTTAPSGTKICTDSVRSSTTEDSVRSSTKKEAD